MLNIFDFEQTNICIAMLNISYKRGCQLMTVVRQHISVVTVKTEGWRGEGRGLGWNDTGLFV